MQKTFLLCESKHSGCEINDEVGLRNLIVGVVSAQSDREAAEILDGELELFEDDDGELEMVVWLPVEQFTVMWDGQEHDAEKALAPEKQGNLLGMDFEGYVWNLPGWGRLVIKIIDPLFNEDCTKLGFAIHEIPVFSG